MHLRKDLFCFFVLFTTLFFSCGKKNKNITEDIWIAPEPVDTIASLNKTEICDTIKIDGTNLMFKIICESDDSLPIVTSYSGQRYKDNSVNLIVRNDSVQILKKHFTKNSFSEYISENKLNKLSLVDFYPDHSKIDTGSKLYFLVKIGDPDDTDENFIFIEIQVDKSGETHIEKVNWEDMLTEPLNIPKDSI